MVPRAVMLLALMIGLSVWATVTFGQDVLIALGLIRTQAKLLIQKLLGVRIPGMRNWVKALERSISKMLAYLKLGWLWQRAKRVP
ncbi:MAG: hypothetical protein AAGD12_13185 [Pseudomonadota bacterium]